ncbi:MAG: DNA repair protein RecN [Acidobacteriota bacterium]
MLKFLSIENFALIDRLEVEFQSGLNLITGETGSGKSILVDAVGLLVGSRASQETIRQGFEKARVEGIFEIATSHPAYIRLLEGGVDLEDNQLIIRREISTAGSNKVFINGTLSTQGFLSEIGALLADIHGQYDQQALLQPGVHLDFLDAFGQNHDLLNKIKEVFLKWREIRALRQQMQAAEREQLQRLDTLQFQLEDIAKLQLRPGLEVELQEEKQLLSSAEQRCQRAQESYQLLYEQEGAALGLLERVQRAVEDLSELDNQFKPVLERCADLRFQLEEIAYQLRDYGQNIEFSPTRLEAVEERLAEIQQACRKYGGSVAEVLAYYERICQEVDSLSGREHQLEDMHQQEQELYHEYLELAGGLSQKRAQSVGALCRQVELALSQLAMENCVFSVELKTDQEHPTEQGIDSAEFLISPNPGEAPRPLARIASGGELSRIILALKSILTLEDYPKTLVFDEVDSGIGGRVASSVGEKLARLAGQHQVFCVTHLPQLACYAKHHFHVDKKVRAERTVIELRLLENAARIEEISRMMAGERVTATTRKQARELLKVPSSKFAVPSA